VAALDLAGVGFSAIGGVDSDDATSGIGLFVVIISLFPEMRMKLLFVSYSFEEDILLVGKNYTGFCGTQDKPRVTAQSTYFLHASY